MARRQRQMCIRDSNIKISDEITIEARYPSFEVFINNWQEEMKEAELTYKIVNHCIGAVITKDARIDAEDVSEEEIAMFVESMNAQQFKKLTDFVSTMPRCCRPYRHCFCPFAPLHRDIQLCRR